MLCPNKINKQTTVFRKQVASLSLGLKPLKWSCFSCVRLCGFRLKLKAFIHVKVRGLFYDFQAIIFSVIYNRVGFCCKKEIKSKFLFIGLA